MSRSTHISLNSWSVLHDAPASSSAKSPGGSEHGQRQGNKVGVELQGGRFRETGPAHQL